MNVVGIVLLVVLAIFVVWLGIDTAIYIYKKTKQRKHQKEVEKTESSDK